MTVNLSMFAGVGAQIFDNNGVPLAGGKIFSYQAGTTTPQATYTTSAGNVAHPNPIILNSAGRVPSGGEIWLTDGANYKFVLKTSADVEIATYENVAGNGSGIFTALAAPNGATLVGFTGFNSQVGTVASLAGNSGSDWVGFLQSGTGAVARSAQDKMRDVLNVADFGAVGNGVTDDTTAIQRAIDAAIANNKNVVFKSGATYLVSAELKVNGNVFLGTTGDGQAIIKTQTNSGIALDINGDVVSPVATTTLSQNLRINTDRMTVASATGVQVGMLARLQSTKAWYHDPREATSISPDTDAVGTAQGGSSSTIQLKASTTSTAFVGLAVTIESGTGAGQARVVQSYDNATKTCTMTANWVTAPDNTSVYRFPQLFKGELHLVRGVSGQTIDVDSQFGDGYAVVTDTYGSALEAVTINFYSPITVKVDNLYIQRPQTANANSFGIRLTYGLNCEITRCRVDYATAAGIQIISAYNTLIERCEINHANDTTTGYGSQTFGAWRSIYRLNKAYGCRRGIDISGTIPSYHCLLESNTVFGGGAQEDGQLYTPEGTIENFGMGSHGTASGTVYRGNLIGNVARGMNLRGRNETIITNKFFGDFSQCAIDLSHGANIAILENEYNNGFNQGGQTAQVEADSFVLANILNFQAQYFVRLQSTYEFGYTSIRNNICRGVNRYFVYFDYTAVGDTPGFEVCDNYAYITPNASSLECALIGVDSGAKNFSLSTINNNVVLGLDTTTTLKTFGANAVIDASGAGINEVTGVKTYATFMADQSVAQIRVPYNGPLHTMFALYCGNSLTNRFFGLLNLNSTTLTSMGASNNVQGFATVPTGTSPTLGNIAINYDGNFLNLANNAGASRTVYVTFFPIS